MKTSLHDKNPINQIQKLSCPYVLKDINQIYQL